jgi:hypothetical protein
LLGLSGENFTAYLAQEVGELSSIRSDANVESVSLSELRRRARSTQVESVELSNGERVVVYRTENEGDVAGDDQLAYLEGALGSPEVRRASLRVEDRHLEIDLPNRTITAHTSAQPPLTAILGSGLPIAWSLTDEQLSLFDAMMALAMHEHSFDLFPTATGEYEPDVLA